MRTSAGRGWWHGPLRIGLVVSALALTACGGGSAPAADVPLPPSDPTQLEYAENLQIDFSEFTLTESGLYLQDLEIGSGPFARANGRVWVQYVGWLADGTVFDGNIGHDPYHFRLGADEVIEAWNEGIIGMRRGGKRRLLVRPGLGYGSRGRATVPPGATLVFYIELVDVD